MLFVMLVEDMTVVIRQQNHVRITRVLRPLLLLDTHYMRDVRRYKISSNICNCYISTIMFLQNHQFCRVMRQISQITKPILEVMLFLVFFIALFSLFGEYWFSNIVKRYRELICFFVLTGYFSFADTNPYVSYLNAMLINKIQ